MTELKTHENSTRKEVFENLTQLLPLPNTIYGDNGYSFFYGKVDAFEITVVDEESYYYAPFNLEITLYLNGGNIKTFYAGFREGIRELKDSDRASILPILKDSHSPIPEVI